MNSSRSDGRTDRPTSLQDAAEQSYGHSGCTAELSGHAKQYLACHLHLESWQNAGHRQRCSEDAPLRWAAVDKVPVDEVHGPQLR